MRLSRSINAEATFACGFLLMALALAAPSSAAEAKNHAPVSSYLALHHRSLISVPPLRSQRCRLSSYSTGPDPMFPLRGNLRPMA
jgi:hypothetical protein